VNKQEKEALQEAIKDQTKKVLWMEVMLDMLKRHQKGVETYGTPLFAHNGRDALKDLYEELLDAVVYLKQVMTERDEPR
jgi:hypothetical protein